LSSAEEPPRVWASERAASESLGAILLVAVVVIAVTTVSGTLVVSKATDDAPPVDLAADATDATVTVSHRGGDALALADLTVVVRVGGSERRFTPSAANVTVGDADDRLEPGEEWERAHGVGVEAGDQVRVLVVHEPTDAVVLDVERTVE
jgi:FlaG/FlaF family flagellin (archaellin)